MLSLNDFGVTTLTFWGHVTSPVTVSHDHWTRNMGFPTAGQFEPTVYLARFLSYSASKYWDYDLEFSWSRDVISHVTTGLAMCGFLLVVNINRWCISHGCWHTELQRFWVHDLDLLGSRDVVCHHKIYKRRKRSRSWPQNLWSSISQQPFKIRCRFLVCQSETKYSGHLTDDVTWPERSRSQLLCEIEGGLKLTTYGKPCTPCPEKTAPLNKTL